MKFTKIITFALIANSVMFSLHAEEIPGQREFLETSMEITEKKAEINNEIINFQKSQANAKKNSSNKLKELESLVDNRIKANAEYTKNTSEANRLALREAQIAEENAKNQVISDMTDSVLNQIKFVDTMSLKYYDMAVRLIRINELSENFSMNKESVEETNREIALDIINSANIVEGLLANASDEDKDELFDLMDSIEREAMSIEGGVSAIEMSSAVMRQANLLKDFSAHLVKAKRSLEVQKRDVAIAAIQGYIGTLEANITSGMDSSEDLMSVIWGDTKSRSSDINEFKRITTKGKASGASINSNSNRRTSNIDSLRNQFTN